MGSELERREELGEVVGRLAEGDLDGRERGRLLARLTSLLASGLRTAGARAALTGRSLADLVDEVAPHVPVRDLATLRAHHGGLSGDELAEAGRQERRGVDQVGFDVLVVGGNRARQHRPAVADLLQARSPRFDASWKEKNGVTATWGETPSSAPSVPR